MGRWPVETQSGFAGGGAGFTGIWWVERGWGASLSGGQGWAALVLRVNEQDFAGYAITVRHGKGGKDRRTMLPARVAEKLKLHLEEVQSLHRQDLAAGYGRVLLPHALGRKYPHAPVSRGDITLIPA